MTRNSANTFWSWPASEWQWLRRILLTLSGTTTHRQAAAPGGQVWPWYIVATIRKVLEDAGIKFIDRGKGGGPGVRLRE